MTFRSVATASLLTFLVLAGCSGTDDAEPEAVATPTAATSSAGPPPSKSPRQADPAGQRVCDAVKAVASDPSKAIPADLMSAGKDGTTSTSASIRIGSQLMFDYAELAAAAAKNGTSKEADARRADMLKQVSAMTTTCATGGYYKTA